LIAIGLVFLSIKGCQYYEVHSIKRDKIPKEFEIIETIYSNISLGCGVAIFKVSPLKVDILKIHHPIFKQYYTKIDFLKIEKDSAFKNLLKKIKGYGTESGNAIGFGKDCIENAKLSQKFINNYYNPNSYISFAGKYGGIVMIYNSKNNEIYYSTAP
jgi:hypothetical protein